MKMLTIFVEGPDDKRFFERIVIPKIDNNFNSIQFYEYATKSNRQVKNYIKALQNMGRRYIFVKDFDCAKCITQRKTNVTEKYSDFNHSLIQIVRVEIESWYAAGINNICYKKLKITKFDNCNNISKNTFQQHLPPKSIVQDKMIEILRNYDLELAKQNNNSIKYFFEKFLLRITEENIDKIA